MQVNQAEKATLDRAEGLGRGYAERQVNVEVGGEQLVATMYYATTIDPALKPYSWYRAHVLAGAYEHKLPPEYVAELEAIEALEDEDRARHAEQMALVPRR